MGTHVGVQGAGKELEGAQHPVCFSLGFLSCGCAQGAGKELEGAQREAAGQGLALAELRLKYRASRKTMASQQTAAAAMSYRQR